MGCPAEVFKDRKVVRAEDVQAHLTSAAAQGQPPLRMFGAEALSPDEDWDDVLASDDYRRLVTLLLRLRKRMKAKFNRHVPLGTLLNDRWLLAGQHNFGEGTNIYDECLILGDVVLGKQCWVGPYTILDGNFAPLRIGDHTSIGSGSHIYSHNTIERTLTGGQAEVYRRPTTIGTNCFIAPMAIVGPGTVLGDFCFVATGSYVQGEFPSHSYIAGNPARKVGNVEFHHGRVQLKMETRHHD